MTVLFAFNSNNKSKGAIDNRSIYLAWVRRYINEYDVNNDNRIFHRKHIYLERKNTYIFLIFILYNIIITIIIFEVFLKFFSVSI